MLAAEGGERPKSEEGKLVEHGIVVVHRTVELPPTCLWVPPPPLLEEEGHRAARALIAEIAYPVRIDRTSTWTAFTADDDPGNALKREIGEAIQKRLA